MVFRIGNKSVSVNYSSLTLAVIVLVGVLLRLYQIPDRFMYGHDQDLASWFVKDVLIDKHWRLVGQETSTQGIFIGPIFYYLLTLFYKGFDMDPIAGAYMVFLFSVFGIFSVYFVFSRVFGDRSAFFATAIYSISSYIVMNDREVVPTMPVIIWSIWYLYALSLVVKGRWKTGAMVVGILIGLIWHINLSLVLGLPAFVVAAFFSKKGFNPKDLVWGLLSFVFLSLPLIVFEFRHGFIQMRSLYLSFSSPQHDIISGTEKMRRVFMLMSKNLHGLLVGAFPSIHYEWVMYCFIVVFLFLALKKFIPLVWFFIFSIWIATYWLFFSFYSKIVSEYYLNGAIVVFLVVFSVALAKMYESERFKHISVILLLLFFVFSVRKFVNTPVNRSGYIWRDKLVAEIKRDASGRGYPCVSVSYITDPGYNLGYRFLMFRKGLKLKPVSEKVPVYTIVYPLKKIFSVDATFGEIGLIYPDYKVYRSDIVDKSCQGSDYNLVEPMWGMPS